MARKKKVATAPIELEVVEVRSTPLKKFLVTAYSALPANRESEAPDISVEIEACSASMASVLMMRQYGRPSYYYMNVADITPATKKRRRGAVEDAE